MPPTGSSILRTVRKVSKITPMKILIVEDNPVMRQMIRSVVADLAEEVIECADGQDAVTAYRLQQFTGADRVLMDLKMPGIGGLEAARRLRSAPPHAQIIVVTPY